MQSTIATMPAACRSPFCTGQRLQNAGVSQVSARCTVPQVTCMAQRLKGRVISTSMDKTAVVEIQKLEKHRIYSKLMRKTTKYFAHDPDNSAEIGQEVQLKAIRPLSKMKRFEITKKLAESDIVI